MIFTKIRNTKGNPAKQKYKLILYFYLSQALLKSIYVKGSRNMPPPRHQLFANLSFIFKVASFLLPYFVRPHGLKAYVKN